MKLARLLVRRLMARNQAHASWMPSPWGLRLLTRLVLTLGLALTLSGCDSSTPTQPDAPQTPTPSAIDGIFISPTTLQLAIGDSQSLTVRVQPADSVTIGISTNLGNFGVDSSGNEAQVVSLALASDGTGRVTFFAGNTAGDASIVANIGSQLTTLRATITPEPTLFLTGLSPIIGSPAGGDIVTIEGQGFSTSTTRPMRVTFGGTAATVLSNTVTATSFQVTTPASKDPVAAGASLTVDVLVTIAADASNAEMSDTLKGAFTFTRGSGPGGPVVFSVTPSAGTNRGGETVAINGSGFETPVQVAFGKGTSGDDFNGVDAQVVSANSAGTQLVVTTPPASTALLNQTVDVLVRNQATGAVTLARSIFTYQGEMVVSDIQPREAPYTADLGTAGPVTILGTGFDDRQFLAIEFGSVVQVGGEVNTERTQITFDQIQAVTVSDCMPPSGPAIVTNLATGAVAQSGASFTYTAEIPRVLSVSPAAGASAGGFPLTLTGTFAATEITNGQVTVDGKNGSSLAANSAAGTLTFTAPPFAGTFDTASCMGGAGTMSIPKQVDIVVTYLNTGCNGTLSGAFSYQPDDTSCTVPNSVPQPSFAFGADPGGDPLTIAFTNTTTETTGVTWEWFFGDGATDNVADPAPHPYAAAGVYTVILRATNSAGTGSFSQSITVPLPGTLPDPPVASFTFTVVDSTVNFTNTTVPLTDVTWEWFFGDGATDDQESPSHDYADPGTYSVTLRATNAGGTDSFSQQITIAGPAPPVASFTFTVSGLTVALSSTSSGNPTTFLWQFGDGMSDSSGPNVSHTYAVASSYNVTLQATNATGTGSFSQTVTVP